MIYNSHWLQSVYSDGSSYFISNPLPKKGEKVSIAIQFLKDAPVENVFIIGKINGTAFPKKMEKVSEKDGLARFEAEILSYENEFSYHFMIATSEKIYHYNQLGIFTYIPNEVYNFRLLYDYTQPSWVKNAVFYQIFPERFCNGNSSLTVKDGEYEFDGFPVQHIKDWNSVPEFYDKAHCLDFYGGDLEGIIQKIPYLKKLGVTALYLNPIFYAATVHKYDCLDYFSVDPHFGGDDALAKLCSELHKNNMKIILDVSINHTGIANRWFNRDGTFFPKTEGAYNNPNNPEREFYFFNKDNTYKAWFDVPTLPTLNYTSEKLRNRLYRDSDSVVKKWLKPPYCIDGWRFDVADVMARNNEIQLAHEVWPEIRASIKEEKKDGYLLAEDWTDGAEFLNGSEWDSPMNYYGSCRPIRAFYGQTDFFSRQSPELSAVPAKISAEDLSAWITEYLARLPHSVSRVLFNLLDSHDIARFHNDPAITFDSVRGAAIMIFTLPGCTNVYYGDEAGIDGRIQDNEGCRYPMPWNKNIEKTKEYQLYSTLASVKNTSPAFCDGGFKILWKEHNVFAYARFTKEELYFTVVSTDSKIRAISLPLDIFGLHFSQKSVPSTDVLGQPIKADIQNNALLLKVPAKKAFLIKM